MRTWLRIAFAKSYMDRQRRAGFLFVLPALLFFSLFERRIVGGLTGAVKG